MLFYNYITHFSSTGCYKVFMNLYNNLPEYGKELLRSIDPDRELDRLECLICAHFFNLEEKKPIRLCINSICAYGHGICSECVEDMQKSKEREGVEVEALRCPFCKELGFARPEYDTSRFQLIQKLSKVVQTLTEISNTARQQTEQQTEKKLKEIVERAEKDIFNITIESRRKSFLLKRLTDRIKSTYEHSQNALKDVELREKELLKREQTFKLMMEDIMNHQKDLETQVERKDREITALKEENRQLRQRLGQREELKSLTQRTANNGRRQERRPNMFYNEDYYFTEFKFKPRRDDSFLQNFNERRPQMMVQLKPGREQYYHVMGEKKTIYHSVLFDASKEENKLMCFSIYSHNKDVTQFKFGLADPSFRQIKNASLSLYFEQSFPQSNEEPVAIMFYINLIKMKLFATSSLLNKSEPLPANLSLSKFTVFVYFVDTKTQITFQ